MVYSLIRVWTKLTLRVYLLGWLTCYLRLSLGLIITDLNPRRRGCLLLNWHGLPDRPSLNRTSGNILGSKFRLCGEVLYPTCLKAWRLVLYMFRGAATIWRVSAEKVWAIESMHNPGFDTSKEHLPNVFLFKSFCANYEWIQIKQIWVILTRYSFIQNTLVRLLILLSPAASISRPGNTCLFLSLCHSLSSWISPYIDNINQSVSATSALQLTSAISALQDFSRQRALGQQT